MKTAMTIIIVAALAAWPWSNALAQSDTFETISFVYVPQLNASYSSLGQRAGERGISLEEFADWIVGNTEVASNWIGETEKNLNGRSDPGPAFPLSQKRLTIFALDERGSIVGRESISMRASEQPVRLGQVLAGRELAGVLGKLSRSHPNPENWHPNPENWIPNADDWSPVNTTRELQQIASDAGRRTVGSGGGKVNFVLIFTPDADRFEVPVTPGVMVFSGDFK